ncbi:MAG: outer membrane protein assembly factor BamD [Sedimentisphaerales bacterium]|nr:outer membrane protein assembly factor BamD [Sedimentisphaerales bacterium]
MITWFSQTVSIKKIREIAVFNKASAIFIFILLFSSSLVGGTWHLQDGRDWQVLSGQKKDEYLLSAAKIKQLIYNGQTKAVEKQLNELKSNFPEIAGEDIDAFIEAEKLFCADKLIKAARSYDSFLDKYPQSRLYEAALERQFSIGTAFLAGRKRNVLGIFKIKSYSQGRKIMENITDRTGDRPISIRAALAVAKNLEKRKKFDQAYHKWSQIHSSWTTGRIAKESLLAMARCQYAAYKGPRFDTSNLISAHSYYESFRLRYPQDAQKLGIDATIQKINHQLALKHLMIGNYYYKTGNYQPASLYYQMVIDNWPGTNAAIMAKKMIAAPRFDDEQVK